MFKFTSTYSGCHLYRSRSEFYINLGMTNLNAYNTLHFHKKEPPPHTQYICKYITRADTRPVPHNIWSCRTVLAGRTKYYATTARRMRDTLFVCFCKCWLYNTHIYFICSKHATFTNVFYFLLKLKKTKGMYEGASKQSADSKILTRHDRAIGSEIPGSSTGLYK